MSLWDTLLIPADKLPFTKKCSLWIVANVKPLNSRARNA